MTAPAPERLAELLAAVEIADGPSRELDADLFIFTAPNVLDTGRINRDVGVVGWWSQNAGYQIAREVPLYTSSVDAAIALVERVLPGWTVRLITGGNGSVLDHAALSFEDRDLDWPVCDVDAKTAPLAILAALIRALITGAHHAD